MTDPVQVDVRRSGRRFEADAVLDLASDPQTVWDTITDYSGLPSFMPGIHACRVLDRQVQASGAERLRVEQHGEFRFMLFAQSMKVMLDIEHDPLRVSEAKASSFDLGLLKRRAIDVFEGRYELGPVTGRRNAPRMQLRYRAVIGLHLPPPPAVGNLAVQQNLSAQLRAVAAEVGRRHARRKVVS